MQIDSIFPYVLSVYPLVLIMLAVKVFRSSMVSLWVALISGICLQIIDGVLGAPHAPWYYVFRANIVVTTSLLCFFALPLHGWLRSLQKTHS